MKSLALAVIGRRVSDSAVQPFMGSEGFSDGTRSLTA